MAEGRWAAGMANRPVVAGMVEHLAAAGLAAVTVEVLVAVDMAAVMVVGSAEFLCCPASGRPSLANDFDQGAFAPAPVKFAIENLFPRPEIELALGDGDHDLTPHDLTLQMRVGVVLPGAVVLVVRDRFMRGQSFQPDLVILQQAVFRIVDEDRSGDVHRVDQTEALLDAALLHQLLDRGGDVDESPAIGHLEPKMFRERFHKVHAKPSG